MRVPNAGRLQLACWGALLLVLILIEGPSPSQTSARKIQNYLLTGRPQARSRSSPDTCLAYRSSGCCPAALSKRELARRQLFSLGIECIAGILGNIVTLTPAFPSACCKLPFFNFICGEDRPVPPQPRPPMPQPQPPVPQPVPNPKPPGSKTQPSSRRRHFL